MAIIAMLAAILLPALSAARERGRRTTCINNLRQFGVAFEMYADDWYEKFPANQFGLFGTAGTKTVYPDLINTTKTFWCPAGINRRLRAPTGAIAQNHSSAPLDGNWSGYENDWFASYAFVFGLSSGNHSPKSVPIVSDRGIYNTKINPADYGFGSADVTTGNHPWGINTLFIDGSARWLNLQEIVFAQEGYVTMPDPFPNVACQNTGLSIVIDVAAEKTAWGE